MMEAENRPKSFEYCNKCHIFDNYPLARCAVCCLPFHMKCILPNVPVTSFDEFERCPNFTFYCDEHMNFCVHKLLSKISLLERKFSEGMEPMIEIYQELENHKKDLSNSSYVKPSNKPNIPITSAAAAASAAGYVNSLPRNRNKRTHSTPPSNDPAKRPKEAEVMDTDDPVVINAVVNTDNSIPPPSLLCMKPDKTIFLSRLHCDTSIDSIKDYIKYHTKIDKEFSIRKMNFNTPRSHASFVINVGNDDDAFNVICNKQIWPEDAIVREYTFLPKHLQIRKPPPRLTTSKSHLE